MDADTETTEASNAETLHDADEGAAARFAEIESKLFQGYEDFLNGARDIGDVTSHHVRLHPLAACGFAFLAGITLARLLRR